MPRVKKKELNELENPPEVPMLLEDGHPNPEYFPNNDRGFEDFQGVLDANDLWNEYIGYLYRVSPKRASTDKDARVDQFVSTMKIEDISKKYGGKKWTVFLNRGAGGKQRLAKKFQFDIEAAPIWQDHETPAEALTSAAAATRAVVEAGGKTDSMISKLIDDVISQRDRALEQGQSFDTGQALQNALALQNEGFKSALTSVTANLGKGNDSTIAVLVPLLTVLIKAATDRKEDPLLQALLNRALEKPEDPFQKITGILGMLRDLGVKIGPGRATAESGSEWAGVIEKGIDKLPDLLGNAANLMAQGRLARSTPGVASQPLAATALPAPRLTTSAPAPAPSPAANKPAAAPDREAAEDTISPEMADRIAQNVVKAAIVRMLFAGDSGDDAAHYAEMAHEPLAKQIVEWLKTDPGQLKADPILAQALTHVNVLAFAEEYVAYFEEKGEEAQPPAGSEPPAPAA